MAEDLYRKINGFFGTPMEEWKAEISSQGEIEYLREIDAAFENRNRGLYDNFPSGIADGEVNYFRREIQNRIAVLLDSKLNVGVVVPDKGNSRFDVV
ncbi:hypothetical protein HY448_01405 [Candidatus Pacearchaeota archaeon]|nr:hypothetical protein [Candidatus Pacearchaeota archaeon]